MFEQLAADVAPRLGAHARRAVSARRGRLRRPCRARRRHAGGAQAPAHAPRGRAGGGRARALGRRRRGPAPPPRRRAARAAPRALRAGHVPRRRARTIRSACSSACCRDSGRTPPGSARSPRRSTWWLEEGDISGCRRAGCATPRSRSHGSSRRRRASSCSSTRICTARTSSRPTREPWLVIDPKPLAAEREFAVAPIVRSGELGHSKREVLYRLDRLCAELGLDRERACGWTIVQTIAWSRRREPS